MKIVINLKDYVSQKSLNKEFNKIFNEHKRLIKRLMPTEYRDQTKLITMRAHDPVWVPLLSLFDTPISLEPLLSASDDNAPNVIFSFSFLNERLEQAMLHIRENVKKNVVYLMGVPFTAYDQQIKDTVCAIIEKNIRSFLFVIWTEIVNRVSKIVILFSN